MPVDSMYLLEMQCNFIITLGVCDDFGFEGWWRTVPVTQFLFLFKGLIKISLGICEFKFLALGNQVKVADEFD